MRRTIIPMVLAVALSLVGGCVVSDNPIGSSAKQAPDYTSKIPGLQGVTLIKLPNVQSLEKVVSPTSLITADKGGKVSLLSRAGSAEVHVTLSFERGSVQEDTYVTVSMDNEVLKLTFEPSGLSFLKPASLDVNAEGLDLSYLPPGTDKNDVKLLLYNPTSGVWEKMPAKSIDINLDNGHLVCRDGSIPHFSIYAFGIIRP